jgi:ketosteroid isomerase-like protein
MREEFEATQEVERLAQRGNTVVIGVRSVGQARRSRVPGDVRWAAAVEVRDGKISRVDVHGEWSKALKAVGLEE